jgi:hypothetical protein
LFDIQYYHHYEAYFASGKMPKELVMKNPFDEDEENVVRMCSVYEAERRVKGLSNCQPTHLFIQRGDSGHPATSTYQASANVNKPT